MGAWAANPWLHRALGWSRDGVWELLHVPPIRRRVGGCGIRFFISMSMSAVQRWLPIECLIGMAAFSEMQAFGASDESVGCSQKVSGASWSIQSDHSRLVVLDLLCSS